VLVAFAAAAVVLLALVADLTSPRVRLWRRARDTRCTARAEGAVVQDPGRERRAEKRARELLRSCVNEEEWAMYRDLGFIRVWTAGLGGDGAYLLYPHLPIIAYQPKTRRLVGEYCITFEDPSRPYGSGRLPDADDVLAKWMALRGDEDAVVSMANMHLPGRQVPIDRLQRDLGRLAQWEHANVRRADHHTAAAS
jgi:hypothetical protein